MDSKLRAARFAELGEGAPAGADAAAEKVRLRDAQREYELSAKDVGGGDTMSADDLVAMRQLIDAAQGKLGEVQRAVAASRLRLLKTAIFGAVAVDGDFPNWVDEAAKRVALMLSKRPQCPECGLPNGRDADGLCAECAVDSAPAEGTDTQTGVVR